MQMKATEQYFHVVLFMLFNVVETFKSVDETRVRGVWPFFFLKKRFLDSKTLLCQNDVHETELMRARTADFHVFTVLKAVVIFKRL